MSLSAPCCLRVGGISSGDEILALWGLIVAGGTDNLLRPSLVGNRLKLHTVLAFMSMVGGLLLFGSAGLILGPVVLTATGALLGIWRRRQADEATARLEHEAILKAAEDLRRGSEGQPIA